MENLNIDQSQNQENKKDEQIDRQIQKIVKIIILPGNGCKNVEKSNWYAYGRDFLRKNLTNSFNNIQLEIILPKCMPDPIKARRNIWIPFIIKDLGCDENTILIGHSSGAEAIMRLAEDQKVMGIILVSACYTDLGCDSEKQAGYYDDEWQWEKIKANTQFIMQFHSKDDPFIPISESDFVNKNLNSEYFVYNNSSHFFTPDQIKDPLNKIVQKVKEILNL